MRFDDKLECWCTLLAVPSRLLWFIAQADAWEVKPLIRTELVVASDHISVANIVTEAIGRLKDCSHLSSRLPQCSTRAWLLLRCHCSGFRPLSNSLRCDSRKVDRSECAEELCILLIWDWTDVVRSFGGTLLILRRFLLVSLLCRGLPCGRLS